MTLPDIDTFDVYGGPLADYSSTEDPTTDLSAADGNRALCNVAMMTHTVLRAFCAFTTNGTSTPTDPASYVHDALWGSAIGVKPTVAYSGSTGVYTVTWPATVSDEGTVLGQTADTHTLALRHARAYVEGANCYLCTATVTSPNVVTVRVYTPSSGALTNTTGVPVVVEAY